MTKGKCINKESEIKLCKTKQKPHQK